MRQTRFRAHVSIERALDYLEGVLAAGARESVEEHLGRPCPDCLEQIRDLGLLVERMRQDRTPEVPAALHARALAAFAYYRWPAHRATLPTVIAELLFDSWAQPLPALVRRAAGDVRRLGYSLGGCTLEVEAERESAGVFVIRGRLEAPDALLHRMDLKVGRERLRTWPDTSGSFVFERVPGGRVRLSLVGPIGHFELPAITLS